MPLAAVPIGKHTITVTFEGKGRGLAKSVTGTTTFTFDRVAATPGLKLLPVAKAGARQLECKGELCDGTKLPVTADAKLSVELGSCDGCTVELTGQKVAVKGEHTSAVFESHERGRRRARQRARDRRHVPPVRGHRHRRRDDRDEAGPARLVARRNRPSPRRAGSNQVRWRARRRAAAQRGHRAPRGGLRRRARGRAGHARPRHRPGGRRDRDGAEPGELRHLREERRQDDGERRAPRAHLRRDHVRSKDREDARAPARSHPPTRGAGIASSAGHAP